MNASIRTGLVLFGLLSVGDIAELAVTDGSHPPYAVAAISAVLGVASLYLLAQAWRGRRGALRALLVLRIVSALTATPAFFVQDVPAAAKVSAAAIFALTALAAALVSPATSRKAVTQ